MIIEIFLLSIVALITIAIILGTAYSLWIGYEQWQYMHDPHKMLFLSSSNKEIQEKLAQVISNYVSETKNYNLVELGCGKAVILKYLTQKYSWKSVTGIEGQKSVWLQAWINYYLVDNLKSKKENQVRLLNQNIFDCISKKPTFHYCYLGVKLMKELYDKGLFTDSIVVSLDYEIENLKPIEIIQLETKSKIQNRLFVYRFL